MRERLFSFLFRALFALLYGREYTRLMRVMSQAKWTAVIKRGDLERLEYLTRLRVVIYNMQAGGGI
jgi:hypothetical protein